MSSEEEVFELFVEVLASEVVVQEVSIGMLDHVVDDDIPTVWEDDDDVPMILAQESGLNGSYIGTGILEGSTGSW